MKTKWKITKNNFLIGFMATTAFLAVVRLIFPSVAKPSYTVKEKTSLNDTTHTQSVISESNKPVDEVKAEIQSFAPSNGLTQFFDANGKEIKHRIIGVANYDESFPDSQHVQYKSAMKYAVKAVRNREDAESRKKELVYIGSNPFYDVKRLSSSIPYLVPTASILLQDIGRNFFDSLQVKNIPLTKLLVTSVLRTKEDVEKLRRYNHNATENSCHLYGTTFDIAYNKYSPITRPVRDDTLKWVLSEVLNDLRKQGRCHIKYEKKQGCFHITVR
ncbi:DUF5715 family protein [Prevotella intermedia]|uniref:Uncharacterized protein n=1 Tax=Prevotella intermedia TaxID=28131 RepID=A0A2G8HZW5_PREIN|nr:DUF5715 family protein [Prevotella intermedia]ATV25532.1 hypothetical protein CTM62_01535 [Prevotella intermedia]ATV38531.1 hypothetical protein CUB95_08290 [Prevotella intermedia]PIK16776.1 hypothetical protein CTI16_12885 [Prevotella intermedia]PIK21210.1 hypothetical protein CTI18_07720 [Prevotella intermedia]PJE99932.1 hypothetical protein CUB97_00765 [Prevotella intermedia]